MTFAPISDMAFVPNRYSSDFKIRLKLRQKKNTCVFQVSALKKLGMVGWHNILFYQIAFFTTLSTIFKQLFDNTFLIFHNKMFRDGGKPR